MEQSSRNMLQLFDLDKNSVNGVIAIYFKPSSTLPLIFPASDTKYLLDSFTERIS